MKRQLTGMLLAILPLAGCQFETAEQKPALKVALYAPEELSANTRTTIFVTVKNGEAIDQVHVQVTPVGSKAAETFETRRRGDHYVASIPFSSGLYLVNGMVHVGQDTYEPKTLVKVGRVSTKQLEQAKELLESDQGPALPSRHHH
ncbi:hypothetical protein [Exiguobacterium flavidum]|uniref:hypothetical protein n=1 Tax=Exiguobacterium flavidum TaxID=2184695 RepID=UPI000DF7920E|nr:hypothetical protein [Exiguobacterium flavidum]